MVASMMVAVVIALGTFTHANYWHSPAFGQPGYYEYDQAFLSLRYCAYAFFGSLFLCMLMIWLCVKLEINLD